MAMNIFLMFSAWRRCLSIALALAVALALALLDQVDLLAAEIADLGHAIDEVGDGVAEVRLDLRQRAAVSSTTSCSRPATIVVGSMCMSARMIAVVSGWMM